MSTILRKSLLRLVKGVAGGWLLFVVILPYGLMSGSPITASILSGGLLMVLVGLAIWDYKRGAAKICPSILDGVILIAVAALSGAVLGILAVVFGYAFRFQWWIAPLAGLIWFALLEARKAAAARSAERGRCA